MVKGKKIRINDNMGGKDRLVLCLSELGGTAILVFLGCMGCVSTVVGKSNSHEQICLTFGLAVMISVQVFGHISGSHINPIVTVAAVTLGNIPLIQVPIYFIGQLLGALLGFGLLKAVTPVEFMGNININTTDGEIIRIPGVCSPIINSQISTGQGFLVEFIISLILALVCCGVWDAKNSDKHDSVAVRFGFAIAVLAMAAGPYTGANMNPVRSFAPALYNGDWKDHWCFTMDDNCSNTNFKFMESYLLKFHGGEICISREYWKEGIAIIYLNHPEKKNAITGKMIVDFRKCIEELENWKEGKSVLLCGLGDNFCSGGDLDFARAIGTPLEGYYMNCVMQDALKRFRKLPIVSVSLIHGATLGGGAELSIFSDYILVTNSVKIGFVHGKMGIITAFGGTTRLLQILGERNTIEVLLTSKIYNAEECIRIGLANKQVTATNRMEEAINFIRKLTVLHSSIIQSFKQVTTYGTSETFEKTLMFEGQLFCPTWGAELNRAALNNHIKHVKK